MWHLFHLMGQKKEKGKKINVNHSAFTGVFLHKELLKVSSLCSTPFFSYWPKGLTKRLIRALYEGAILMYQ